LKKYYVFKPLTKFTTLPNVQLIQQNRPWNGGQMSVLDNLEVVIPEWKKTVKVQAPTAPGVPFVVTVDNKTETIPFFYSKVDGHREEFLFMDFSDPATKLTLRIETSFGMKVTVSAHQAGATIYNDISVDIPRHPELKGQTGGVLGRWNGDPKDDNLDSQGKAQPLDAGFSHAFGDSWIIPSAGGPSPKETEDQKKKYEDHVKAITPEDRIKYDKLCRANLYTKQMHSCAKGTGRAAAAINDCIVDLSFIKDPKQQQEFLKAMVAKYASECPNHHKIKFHETPKCCGTFYQASNYEMRGQKVCGDLAVVGEDYRGNLGISSLKIDPGCFIEAFKGINFAGEKKIFPASTTFVGDWNDLILSLKVRPVCCGTIFQNYNYDHHGLVGGQKVCGDLASLSKDFEGFKGISSVKVDPGCVIEVFKGINFAGGKYIFKASSTNVGDACNDKILSLKVRPA